MSQRTLELRLYPNKVQINRLYNQLYLCRQLYNSALDERRWNYRTDHTSISARYQSKELPEIRKTVRGYDSIHSQVLQNVIRRLDLAFNNFFEKRSGFPKYKGRYQYRSMTYKQPGAPYGPGGFTYLNDKLKLSFIGNIRTFHKVKPSWHNVQCVPKTCIIKWESDGNWYAYIVFNVPEQNLVREYIGPKPAIGNDLGLTTLSTLSDGTEVSNLRAYKKSEKKLRRLQRKASRRKKGSSKKKKANKKVAKLHHRIANQRRDYLHKISRSIANNYGLVAFEDSLAGLAKGMLAKHVLDAGWGTLKRYTKYKCPEEHSEYVEVDKNGTTTDCNRCGFKVPKTLAERIHNCPRCHIELPRDLNSAVIVKIRGIEKYVKSREEVVPTDCGELTPVETGPLLVAERQLASLVVEAGSPAL